MYAHCDGLAAPRSGWAPSRDHKIFWTQWTRERGWIRSRRLAKTCVRKGFELAIFCSLDTRERPGRTFRRLLNWFETHGPTILAFRFPIRCPELSSLSECTPSWVRKPIGRTAK